MKKSRRIASLLISAAVLLTQCGIQNDTYAFFDDEIAKESSISEYYVNTRLNDIRNQGEYGSCLAFSSIGLVENSILAKENKNYDLSELHMSYFMYNKVQDPLKNAFDKAEYVTDGSVNYLEQGGQYRYAYRRLASFAGAVLESSVPYELAGSTLNSDNTINMEVIDGNLEYANAVQLKNAYIIPYRMREDIKKAIMQYGAVGIEYKESKNEADSYKGGVFNSYYSKNAIEYRGKHAVNIVGYNDNFPKENFVVPAENDGAWLVRNSWGNQGENHYGYFWMSYDEPSIGSDVYVFDCVSDESDEFYDYNYQYSNSIDTKEYNVADSHDNSIVKIANEYVVKNKKELLKAVGFETTTKDFSYSVDVYCNLKDSNNPESGRKLTSAKGYEKYGGFITAKVDNEVLLQKNERYSVVITIKSESGNAYFNADFSHDETDKTTGIKYGHICVANANAGESFLYSDKNDKWFDYGVLNNANINIKAFTNEYRGNESVENKGIEVLNDISRMNIKEIEYLMVRPVPYDSVTGDYRFESSDSSIVNVDSITGKVEALKRGCATITIYDLLNTSSVDVQVEVVNEIKKFELNKHEIVSNVGNKEKVSATLEPIDADNISAIHYSSSNDNVATVDADGEITMHAYGEATIYATMGEYVDSLQLYVLDKKTECKAYSNGDMTNTIEYLWGKNEDIINIEGVLSDGVVTRIATISDKTSGKYIHEDINSSDIVFYRIVRKYNMDGKIIEDITTTPVVYNVIYHLSGGINSSSNKTNYCISLILREPAKSEYSFEGWYLDKDFSIKQQSEAICTGDINLYAKWKWNPDKPNITAVKNVDSGIVIEWSKVKNATGYKIYRKKGSESYVEIKTITSGTTVKYTDKSAVKGEKYTYAIKAKKADAVSKLSNEKGIIRMITPTVKSVTNESNGVKISYNKITGATGYQILRKEANGKLVTIKKITNKDTISFVDTTAKNGTTYVYTVRAINGNYTSNYDAAGKKIVRLNSSKVSAINISKNSIKLSWAVNKSADAYQIKYVCGSSTKIVNISDKKIISYVIKNLTKGNYYKICVRSLKKGKNITYYSAWSSIKTVKIEK